MKYSLVLCLGLCLLAPRVASAHEPLWGESPQTFAFGILHPEIRFGFENDASLIKGSHSIANPEVLRTTRLDALFSLQYAPKTALNLKLEIPLAQVLNAQNREGQSQHTGVTGIGDVTLSAKSRFFQKFGPDWKLHQSYTVGLQLPTGTHNGRAPDGTLLSPSGQPGSGKWGYLLSYAFAYERLQDTVWISAVYRGDFGGAGRKGSVLELDANYGYWVKRPKRPQDLGVILAAGPHISVVGHDRLAGGNDPNSGLALWGVEASIIATKDQAQFRAGFFVPLSQQVSGTQLRPDIQIRAGFEILL